ncbi:MAG: methionine synthase [Clostridium sp.]|nr:methionine synthase [Clostridium sp.]
MERLDSRLEKEILVLDGAMGTMVMNAGLDEEDFRGERFASHPISLKGCNDALCLTRPDVIYGIHREYLRAGADIISTNTFNANKFSLAEYRLGECAEEISQAGAALARKAVDDYCEENGIEAERRPFVAGSVGPTGISLSIGARGESGEACDFEAMAAAYGQQAAGLIRGGADILLIETIFDALNAKAAAYGAMRAMEEAGKRLPIMVSATLTEQGRLLSGQTIGQFVEAMKHCRPVSFGLNCGFGAEALKPWAEKLAEISPAHVSMHPNAGLPDAMGRYLDSPEKMAEELSGLLGAGALNIIGGCCGTGPRHIELIKEKAKAVRPRPLPKASAGCGGFFKVGERCNVAGSRKFLRLVKEGKWNECLDIAAGQAEGGAQALDINMDDAMLDAKESMRKFVGMLVSDPCLSAMPLMIDSSDFGVIMSAMRQMPTKGIVNSISLKNGEEEFLSHAKEIYAMGCSMVVMAFDENGQADTLERKIEICGRAYRLLTERGGIPAEDIIFDPNVLAVATGIESYARYALDFIRATEWIKANLPGARVSGGVSNLSFSFRGIDPVRKAMHSIFLEHCIEKGMDMAIVNPSTPLTSEWVEPELHELIEDALLCRRDDATERLVACAMRIKAELEAAKEKKKAVASAQTMAEENATTACDRLAKKIEGGDASELGPLIGEALGECGGLAMEVVNRSLMAGMDKVGEKFGKGEMFLPQVVRSADAMKKAVEILTPIIEEQRGGEQGGTGAAKRPLVVLATVKGDVHDIGKNIVAIVLRCGGYDVLDLGVMVEAETIVESAIENKAAAIGLSGLITPSLHEMGVVALLMQERGLDIPLFVGGATTSDLHTAVKIAPLYSGAVVRTGDAASLPSAIAKHIDAEGAEMAREELARTQQRLRDEYAISVPLLSLDEARKRADSVEFSAQAPLHPGVHEFKISVSEAAPLINWRAFLKEWGLDVSGEASEHDKREAERLTRDARGMLGGMDGKLSAKVIIANACGEGDDIVAEMPDKTKLRIPTLRSLAPNPTTGKCLAMSDFVCADGDYIGIFCVTVAGSGIGEASAKLKGEDEYGALMLQSLSHRLAEAATEWMHRHARRVLWGIGDKEGIRPAVGYSSLPDQSIVKILDKALDYASMGVSVTEHGALYPSGTTTGLIIGHPSARYFSVGALTEEARREYAGRREMDIEELRQYI